MGGTDILGTPLTVEVMPRKPVKQYRGFSSPQGMAVTKEGILIVADYGNHCINIINTTGGKKIRSFGQCGSGQLQFWNLHGMALTRDGHIVVPADRKNRRLQLLTVDLEGAFVSPVAFEGSQLFTV